MSEHFNYYDDWKAAELSCAPCKLTIKGSDCPTDVFTEVFELNCPKCGAILGIVAHPTIEESRQNWEKLSDLEKYQLQKLEENGKRFDEESLKSPNQLLDLHDKEIVLMWGTDGKEGDSGGLYTTISYGDKVLWKEPAIYEGYGRFEEVVNILSAKYGKRLQDLVPTRSSEVYLYGDSLMAPDRVKKVRLQLWLRGWENPPKAP